MKFQFSFLFFFCFLSLFSQERIDHKELYYENFLAYRYDNDQLFSGIVYKARKNGQVVYEDSISNGRLIKMRIFFNRDPKRVSTEYYYYPNSFKIKKQITHEYKRPYIEHLYFDANGKKSLVETYIDTLLTYKCEYENGKKHGIEFCLNEDGSTWTKHFHHGKQIKDKD